MPMVNDARCDCGDPCILNSDLDEAEARIERLEIALKRIADGVTCGSLMSQIERMEQIAREALE